MCRSQITNLVETWNNIINKNSHNFGNDWKDTVKSSFLLKIMGSTGSIVGKWKSKILQWLKNLFLKFHCNNLIFEIRRWYLKILYNWWTPSTTKRGGTGNFPTDLFPSAGKIWLSLDREHFLQWMKTCTKVYKSAVKCNAMNPPNFQVTRICTYFHTPSTHKALQPEHLIKANVCFALIGCSGWNRLQSTDMEKKNF